MSVVPWSVPGFRSRRVRRILPVLALAVVALAVWALTGRAATVVPSVDPLARVVTKSGGVTKTTLVPVGGAPVPIDVDNAPGGLPDVDVAVGAADSSELPDRTVVPNVAISRNQNAVRAGAKAPPLDIAVSLVIRNALNPLGRLADVTYGYRTPAGATVPPRVTAKLVGPVEGGFVDPLVIKLEAPGYGGPLDVVARAKTDSFEGDFTTAFDPIPPLTTLRADPTDAGLDLHYDRGGPHEDVHVAAVSKLRDPQTGTSRTIGAEIERLPSAIDVRYANTQATADRPDGALTIDFASSSLLAKADVEATYRQTDPQGNVATDAVARAAGLPGALATRIESKFIRTPDTDDDPAAGDDEFSRGTFTASAGEVDSVDFEARNHEGDQARLFKPAVGPGQMLTAATKTLRPGVAVWRAAGRLFGVRSVVFERTGPALDGVDLVAKIGDGKRPLRAAFDLDDRDPGALTASEEEDANAGEGDEEESGKRIAIDSTVTPLPATLHTTFAPSRPSRQGATPIEITYDSSAPVHVEAKGVVAEGAFDACGALQVTCLSSVEVHRLPPRLEVKLPGKGASDLSVRHTGPADAKPDVAATIDRTEDNIAERVWAQVRLTGIPNEITGRLDSPKGVLRAAEFHACRYDFGTGACTSEEGKLDRVEFVQRKQPDRGALPARPDTSRQFVTVLGRDEQREVTGRVDGLRHLAFRQRLTDATIPQPAGTLGVRVAAAERSAFQTVVDQRKGTGAAAEAGEVDVKVATLPADFRACVREEQPGRPAKPPVADELLAECEKLDGVLGRDADGHESTPLTAFYKTAGGEGTPVTADIRTLGPDKQDLAAGGQPRPKVTELHSELSAVPGELRVDAITPADASEAIRCGQGSPADCRETPARARRKLEVQYDAQQPIGTIKFGLQSRRADSLCGDPRPDRKAVCVDGVLRALPGDVKVTYDGDDGRLDTPDAANGDFTVDVGKPDGDQPKLSIEDLNLSSVSPDDPKTADHDPSAITLKDVDIKGIAGLLVGQFRKLPAGTRAEPELARAFFDACSEDPCAGIEHISFEATNVLVPDFLPAVPAAAGLQPDHQRFSFVQRGEAFAAKGSIGSLRRLEMSKLAGGTISPRLTRLGAAIGGTQPLRAYIDRDDGARQQLIDAVLTNVPRTVDLCMRQALTAGETPPQASTPCDDADRSDVALSVKTEAGAAKPGIDVRRLMIRSAGETEPDVDGSVDIRGLGSRIDVRARTSGAPRVRLEGRDSDGKLANVVDRVTFDIGNGSPLEGTAYPHVPLPGSGAQLADAANRLQVVKLNDRVRATGSLSKLKSFELVPGAPCVADGTAFPTSGFPVDKVPEYQCVRVNAAGDESLAFAVRTLEARGTKRDVLAIDDGYLSKLPADGIGVTIAKSPQRGSAPLCTGHAAGRAADGCRPPLLDIAAPHGGTVEARAQVAVGGEADLAALREAKPLDILSQRLDYNAPPRDYRTASGERARGARVRVGTHAGGASLLLGMNLDLPDFVRVFPPVTYSCTHFDLNAVDEVNGCNDSASENFGGQANRGYSATDVGLRIEGRDGDAFAGSTPVGSLGRGALFVRDFAKNSDIVLTGTPPGQTADANAAPPIPEGGTKANLEKNGWPAGDHDLGAPLPGYLDARVFLRNDHNATKGETAASGQHNFAQVDGRMNADFNATIRLNERKCIPGFTSRLLYLRFGDPGHDPLCSPSGGTNRAGEHVPGTQFSIRNAPGTTNGDFSSPSWRLRAETRSQFEEKVTSNKECAGLDFNVLNTGIGAELCLVIPAPEDVWTNVDLNFASESNNPTRTLEAVVDRINHTAAVDLRGFAGTYPLRTPIGQGGRIPSPFSASAGIRLDRFDLGLRAGAGLGLVGGSIEAGLDGDLIAHGVNDNSAGMRLRQQLLATYLASEGSGPGRLHTDLRWAPTVKLAGQAAFGLVKGDVEAKGPAIPIPLDFRKCDTGGLFGAINGFRTVAGQKRAATIGVGVPGWSVLIGAAPAKSLDALLALLPPIACIAFRTDHTPLIDGSHPAPRFEEPGRIIRHVDVPAGQPAPPSGATPEPVKIIDPVEDKPRASDVTIGGKHKLCGEIEGDTVTFDATADIEVGATGEEATATVVKNGDPTKVTVACDGRLQVTARRILVAKGASIEADGASVANPIQDGAQVRARTGPGTERSGRGAAHGSYGGPNGFNHSIYNTKQYTREQDDRGSPGAGMGAEAFSEAGGAILLKAVDKIEVDGSLSAKAPPARGQGQPDCRDNSVGGGSGGSVILTAPWVLTRNSARLDVSGGNGAGAGGGGAGGRIVYEAMRLDDNSANEHFVGGQGGPGEGACPAATGKFGLSGAIDRGPDNPHQATVSVAAATKAWTNASSLKLRVDARHPARAAHTIAPYTVFVCHQRVRAQDTDKGFEDPELNPDDVDGHRTPRDVVEDQAQRDRPCLPVRFEQPTDVDNGRYVREVDFPLTDDGNIYGIFAIGAAGQYNPELPSTIANLDFQRFTPDKSPIKVGYDADLPGTFTREGSISGSAKCPNWNGTDADPQPASVPSVCTKEAVGSFYLDAFQDDSGIESIRCGVLGATREYPQECGVGPASVALGTGDGLKRVIARATDRAGNNSDDLGSFGHRGRWFVDTTRPGKPVITVTNPEAATNGWHRRPPSVKVVATDPSPSSGFEAQGMIFAVDGDEKHCLGAGATPLGPRAATATCDLGSKAPIPAEGVHTFTATMTDRLGNVSEVSVPQTMRVDVRAPRSSVVLSPVAGDGNARDGGGVHLFRTRPAFAFTALDNAGGSGVDLSGKRASLPAGHPRKLESGVSAVLWKLDEGSWQRYDPEADELNRISDGVHKLCWYAVDIAGNAEDKSSPGNCRTVRVDSTAPALTVTETPGADGGDGWYRSAVPVVTATAADPVHDASTGADPATFQVQLDGGDWRSIPAVTDGDKATAVYRMTDEGVREVRFRVGDRNGNRSAVGEVVLKRDTSPPETSESTFPPRPNEQGWHRRPVSVTLGAGDGRGGSGVARTTVAVDDGPEADYTAPVVLDEGTFAPRRLRAFSTDVAWLDGPAIERSYAVDSTAPVPLATGATAANAVDGPATLRFDAGDARTPLVRVKVHVYDLTGKVVRTLDVPGSHPGGFREPGPGSVRWDGRGDDGLVVAPGIYHHRVQALDQAGNAAISGESPSYAVLYVSCVYARVTVPTILRLTARIGSCPAGSF